MLYVCGKKQKVYNIIQTMYCCYIFFQIHQKQRAVRKKMSLIMKME